jgi:PAS domain S-box-containing protein
MSSTDHLSELESLRSKVADLACELAEREQSMRAQSHHFEAATQDLRARSRLLHAIIEGTAAETGDEFLTSLVMHLTSALRVQYAVIGVVCEGRSKKIRTLAVAAGGNLVENFEYELAHTPCATALTQTFACFDRDLQATFPQSQRLADLGAESYCAVRLRSKGGVVTGLLVVMDTKPLQQGDNLQSLLEVFAPRVAVEIDRRRAEQERAQALADLHNVIESIPDIVFALDRQGNLMKWNRRLEVVTGYSPEELLNKPALAFVPLEEQFRTAAAIQRVFTEGYAELDGQMLTKDLRIIPYHWTGALLKNALGEPIGITGVGRDVSEKKQAEEKLTQQRRHLVDAQALAHLGSWDWDIDTGKARWSDELFRIFGHEPGSISVTYDTFLASLHPDDRDSVLAAINDALLGVRAYDMEYRIVRPNGEVRFIYARGDLHRDAIGHPISMAGTVLDITERKRIEDALRASEERWHLAVIGSNDGIWDWNIQTGDVFFSSRWKAMRGFEDHEIKNDVDEWRSRIHPNDFDRVLQSLDAYLAKQAREFCVEYRVRRKDESYMWILDRGVALWAEDGTPTRMTGSEADVTERKWAETSLRQGEERYRSLVDNAPIGIFLNEGGRFAYLNREMQRILNATSAEQLIGTPVLDRIAPEFHNVVKDRIRTLMDNQQPVPSLDEQYVRLDGSRVDVAVTAIPASIGERPMMQVLVLDIAERKRVEEALCQRERELRTALEDRERISQDLHDGILQSLFAVGLTLEASKSMMSPRARKMSGAQLNQAIDQLNYVMSEIRNFIAGLGSNLLQGKNLQAALRHMLSSLTQNQPTRVRLAVEDRAAQAVSVEQSPHLLLVIQEAVSNCIRHGRAQEATVSLKMLKRGIRLSVRDNGRGFNSEAAVGPGHGLTNMAVRARKIGGRFTVMSKVNEGTRIVLDLPIEASDVLR